VHFLKLILRNALRHRLRTFLTILGLVVAVLSFGLLQSVVQAWYSGAAAAAPTRLITRNALSLTFPLPLFYREKIKAVEGVSSVAIANWFGGVYQDPKNFFPQFAVDAVPYFAAYPEFVVAPEDFAAFLRDRKGAIVGRRLAEQYGFKVGDTIPIKGQAFPGTWEFTIRAIYDGRETRTDTATFFFHWQYLNERMQKTAPARANQVGVFVVDIDDPDRSAAVSEKIDELFRNSTAETRTETEQAFQLGFVAMSGAIVTAIRIVSFVVIAIILAVMANTMAMTARERMSEYATLKALGFPPSYVGRLILGESLAIALIGAAIGVALSFPVGAWFASKVGTMFPVFEVSRSTVLGQFACAAAVGLLAAALPMRRAAKVNIVEGLRAIG
jgi:putative ABC transport system permease protein